MPRFPTHRRVRITFGLLTLGVLFGVTPAARAQQQGSALPVPRLFTIYPPGGKIGTTVEVTFTGTDIEEPQALLFSHPGIKAEAVPPPPPPPPDPKKKPPAPPPPPAQVTKFKVHIGADVPPGLHDVHLVNKWGVSNPRAFAVGDLAEVLEKEPNNDVEQAQRVELNSVINGAISAPTDVDYYVFHGKKGQRVVLSCLTSTIDSRLHAALELYAPTGKRLAFNRNYRAYDALVDATLPADGDYKVRVHEFTYTQGNAEYFYRLSISSAPWIDAIVPSVVEPGKPNTITIYGRNLPGGKLDPSTKVAGRVLEKLTATVTPPSEPAAVKQLHFSGHIPPAASGLDGFEYHVRNATGVSNPYLLTLARAPVVVANGTNVSAAKAQEVTVPCEIAGNLLKRRQRAWFSFTATKGQVWSIEVFSSRLGAPTDMYFLLRNPANKQTIVELDDDPNTLSQTKFYTRNEDPPRFRFVAPADGKYELMVSSRDADVRAGPRQLYRVRIAPEQPDFRLIAMGPGDYRPGPPVVLRDSNQLGTVLAWRDDGFSGSITITAEGLPAGVTCPPVTLGPNLKQVPLVFDAALAATPGVYPITIKGTAKINGQTVVHLARPASITWPTQPGQGIPVISRLNKTFLVAVREQAPPFRVTASLEKPFIVQGDKTNLKLKLARLQTDFKTPLQAIALDLPQNLLTVNNNQPMNLNPGKDEGTFPVQANANLLPGTYTIVLRAAAQVPYNKDPKAKQKPNINVVFPSTAVQLLVLPKQVATLSLANANVSTKIGAQGEVVLRLARLHDYAGEFKVQLILPPNIKGVSTDAVTVPGNGSEAHLIVRVAPDVKPMNLQNLVVRATATIHGNLPTVHEIKVNVNIVK